MMEEEKQNEVLTRRLDENVEVSSIGQIERVIKKLQRDKKYSDDTKVRMMKTLIKKRNDLLEGLHAER